MKNKPVEEILEFSIEKIKTLSNEEEYPSISEELRFSIYYLINKSNKNIFQKTVSKLLQSRSGEIRLIVSEYYFAKNQPEKSLPIIIEILDSLNIDHNVSDAIDMDVAHYADAHMLETLKINHRNNEVNISQGLKHIISVMKTAILHSTNHGC
ncbi:hypothetical protein [Janthinobacterium sp. PC23-8]|uniref:hypothetical protein n=1 Tax=Janthinobacterium sp. PC23-8 TaxID=2012679 RepID=UPI00114013B5|nr:hypothetical protein [Janthinobacterium sp. PC23-8]